jgi:hypothetical protein
LQKTGIRRAAKMTYSGVAVSLRQLPSPRVIRSPMPAFFPRSRAALLAGALVFAAIPVASGQNTGEQKPPEQVQKPPATPPVDAAKEEKKKIDEFAEAARLLPGAAGHPECVWTGRRVVSLLWRDDIETAFRHLDLYDRFGCPSGHIQASFRCLILHSNSVDPKSPDSLNGRVNACWMNPADPAPAPPPPAAAAPPSSTSNH